MYDVPDALLLKIYHYVCFWRIFVRIIHSCEPFNFPTASFSINPTFIGGLAIRKRSGDVNEIETTILGDRVPGSLSAMLKWCYRGCDDSSASPRELSSYKGDALYIAVAVFAREA
jgi:hypothetical protein